MNDTEISGTERPERRKNISTRKRTENELESLAKFPDENPHPVMRISKECEILYANRSSLPLLKTWEREVGEKLPDDLCGFVREALKSEVMIEIEVVCGEHVFSVIFTPISGADYLNIYGSDITRRKQMEKELRATRDELERRIISAEAQLLQAQKMEAVGQLAGGVAHDFNNMITVIQGNIDLALAVVGEDEPVYRNLKEVRRVSSKAAALTRQLLTFSRHQPMQKEILNINARIEEMCKMLARLVGENISLRTELAHDLWNVDADPGQLEQVVMNLAVNARDAMPNGGKLFIRTENVLINEADCDFVEVCKPGKYILLSVEDTGSGMDEFTRMHIFEPFFTTKGASKGTGLGLAVVYGIVKSHDGWINVYSEPGSGSTFKIFLPAVSSEVEKPSVEPEKIEGVCGGRERILVVEDEDDLRELAKMMLEMNGYRVTTAADYDEAVSIFQKDEGRFDLLFTDMMLTGRSGIELSEELKGIRPGLMVLFSSGYSDDHFQMSSINQDEYGFLGKPYTLTELLQAVRGILDRK